MAPLQQTHLLQPQTVHEFILEKELPGLEEAVQRGEDSMALNERPMFPLDQSRKRSIAEEECTCPHLLSVFPDHLHVQLVPSSVSWIRSDPSTQVYRIQDPIAALHLRSQLEDDGTIVLPPPNGSLLHPLLYGDEEERRNLVVRPGMPEFYHAHLEAAPSHPSVAPGDAAGPVAPRVSSAVTGTNAINEGAKIASSDDPLNHGAMAEEDQKLLITPELKSTEENATAVHKTKKEEEGATENQPNVEDAAVLQGSTVKTMEMSEPHTGASEVKEDVTKGESIPPLELLSSSEVKPERETVDTKKLDDQAVVTTKRELETIEATNTDVVVEYYLPESTFLQYQKIEEQILQIRQNGLSKRSKKKHFVQGPPNLPPLLPVTSMNVPAKQHPPVPEETLRIERDRQTWYSERQKQVVAQSALLLEQYRRSRRKHWSIRKETAVRRQTVPAPLAPNAVPFGSCGGTNNSTDASVSAAVAEDQWMQCLECSHGGVHDESRHHFLSSNHRFGTWIHCRLSGQQCMQRRSHPCFNGMDDANVAHQP
jgi:hypothetical protein